MEGACVRGTMPRAPRHKTHVEAKASEDPEDHSHTEYPSTSIHIFFPPPCMDLGVAHPPIYYTHPADQNLKVKSTTHFGAKHLRSNHPYPRKNAFA